MVSNLLSAVVSDVLRVARNESFFKEAKEDRSVATVDALGSNYPQALRVYLATVSGETFLQDIEQIIPTLGTGASIFKDVPELMKGKGNALFAATLDVLTDDLLAWLRAEDNGASQLSAYCVHVKQAGNLYERILVRESQELLLASRQIDSPIIQTAVGVTDVQRKEMLEETDMSGIPSLVTNRELLGGVRQFYNGTMQDDSWRARLTHVLNVVS